jgi:hypothetical protein
MKSHAHPAPLSCRAHTSTPVMVSSITPLLPADGAARLEFNMYQVHHIIKSGHDTIMFNLNNPPRDDLENFLGYCEAWADVIETHHDIQRTSRGLRIASSHLMFSLQSNLYFHS